jgi:hypothetical protein
MSYHTASAITGYSQADELICPGPRFGEDAVKSAGWNAAVGLPQ